MWERLSSADQHSRERLAVRRKRIRRRLFIASIIASCVLLGTALYGMQQSSVRISHVVIYGADQSLAQVALGALQGSYLGIIPYDSTFFFSAARIRADILASHPEIAAISIYRNGLNGLSVKVSDRIAIARWCGDSPVTMRPEPIATSSRQGLAASTTESFDISKCLVFDANGFLYASGPETAFVNPFAVYEPLGGDLATTSLLIGKILPNAYRFPAAFDLARQLTTLGSPVATVVFRGDEVDMYLKSGTRVTYVLGSEGGAYTALTSAHDSLDLADGSIDYVDLRFDGKVYVKRVEAKK